MPYLDGVFDLVFPAFDSPEKLRIIENGLQEVQEYLPINAATESQREQQREEARKKIKKSIGNGDFWALIFYSPELFNFCETDPVLIAHWSALWKHQHKTTATVLGLQNYVGKASNYDNTAFHKHLAWYLSVTACTRRFPRKHIIAFRQVAHALGFPLNRSMTMRILAANKQRLHNQANSDNGQPYKQPKHYKKR